jgi:hypothetical protein
MISVGKINTDGKRPRILSEPSLVTELAQVHCPEWPIMGGGLFRFG